MAPSTRNAMFYLTFLAAIVSHAAADACDSKVLNAVNTYRANHGSSALTWSLDLAYQSQALLDLLEGSETLDKTLSLDDAVQSVWSTCVPGVDAVVSGTCKDAVDAWYNQGQNYVYSPTPMTTNKANLDFDSPDFLGDFVQLVWKATTKVGCSSVVTHDAEHTETCLMVACTYMADVQNTENSLYANVAEPKDLLITVDAAQAESAERRRAVLEESPIVVPGEESSTTSEESSTSEGSASETSAESAMRRMLRK